LAEHRKPMRIMHVDHGSTYGGAERSLIELAVAQRSMGHEPTIVSGVAGRFVDEAASAGFEVSTLGWSDRLVSTPLHAGLTTLVLSLPAMVRAALAFRAHVAHADVDVVHVHTRKAQLIATASLVGLRVQLVWHLRDAPPSRRLARAALRVWSRRVDHAVAISRWLIRAYREAGIRPRSGSIGLIPSGINIEDLRDLPTPWLDGLRDPVVGYVGQIAARKGPDVFVDAANRLSDLPSASFVLIGDVAFPRAEGEFGRSLARTIATSTAKRSIRWVPATSGPRAAFEQIDILVCPSVEPEPLGRVLVEAMASRRPIVTVRSGAAADLLDATSAILVERPDPDAVAKAIRRLIEDVGLARSLADAASPLAGAFDPLEIARDMDLEYASVVR
jgi:glycosyltransferase involved in cell wall biosynthesis